MIIKGFQKNSLIDYPGKICSVIFLPRCNFKCGYCYNPELVLDKELPEISEDYVLEELEKRKKFIDGVTITGGEPTIHRDLPRLIIKLKNRGFLVKLDTNGTNPEMLKSLIKSRLVDFIAMDVKNIINKYGGTVNVKFNYESLKESMAEIMKSGLEHEFRTTVIPILHEKEDIIKIAQQLRGAKKYVIQQFFPAEKMLDKSFLAEKKYSKEDLEEIRKECSQYVKTEIRNL